MTRYIGNEIAIVYEMAEFHRFPVRSVLGPKDKCAFAPSPYTLIGIVG